MKYKYYYDDEYIKDFSKKVRKEEECVLSSFH